MWLILSVRVPVGQPMMGIGRGEREMRGMNGSEVPPEGLHRGAFLQVPTLVFPTESGTGQSRPSLTQLHGSSSLVSPKLLPSDINSVHLYQSCHLSILFITSGNTSPRAISRAERERKVSMRLHRGAPANVSSSDLTARHDQSRISTSQVRKCLRLVLSVLAFK